MAAITTTQLLYEVRSACHRSALIRHIEERILDIDVLHARAYLSLPGTFINAFYNLATDKTAFALIQAGRRVYGVDNAKIGWHYHPFADPDQHIVCPQMTFADFLHELEKNFVL